MTEISADDYAYHARSTAYYLDYPDERKQWDTVFYGYNEEVNELLTDKIHPKELTAKLWGWNVETKLTSILEADKVSEAGDVLYFINAAGMLRGIPLREMLIEGIKRYTGEIPIAMNEMLSDFDYHIAGRMGEAVPEEYKPNYHIWKMWDFAPFEDTLHIVLSEPTYAKGPLRMIGDGRYALDRLLSTFGRFMMPETSKEEEFVSAAGLALGGLSLVLQHRFNSSLAEAAQNNMAKRERRLVFNTLVAGDDSERSRPVNQPRPRIDIEQNTAENLLNAPFPKM